MKYVYILQSLSDPERHYTGLTNSPRDRLAMHNAGECAHTVKFGPWKILTAISFADEEKAVRFEKYLKSGSGRAFARRHF